MPGGFGLFPGGHGDFGGFVQPVIGPPGAGFGQGPAFFVPFGQPWSDRWAQDVVVYAGYDGPQMVIRWTPPEGAITSLRIYRKEREYPKSPDDPEAVKVLELAGVAAQVADSFADTSKNDDKVGADPTPGVWYYYRIFTENTPAGLQAQPGTGWLYDPLGGSEGFDLCYSPDGFDADVWQTHLPDIWRALDVSTSQKQLTLYTDAASSERVTLLTHNETEGFGQRFIRVMSWLYRRLFVHIDEAHQHYDFQRVRADALQHLSTQLHTHLHEHHDDPKYTLNTQRRDLQDATLRHRRKGKLTFLDKVVEQETDQVPVASVEMRDRCLFAWNPQEPNDINGGFIFGGGPEAGQVEDFDDPNTYAWNPSIQSPYNERGWRTYFTTPLPLGSRRRLLAEVTYAKPATVTMELWEQDQFRERVT